MEDQKKDDQRAIARQMVEDGLSPPPGSASLLAEVSDGAGGLRTEKTGRRIERFLMIIEY